MKMGARTGCHQKYDRSYSIFGYQLPLCARCTGILAGQLIALFYLPFCSGQTAADFLLPAVLSVFLLGIDGIGQLKGFWVSNNPRRLITGLLCGFFPSAVFFALMKGALNYLLNFLP